MAANDSQQECGLMDLGKLGVWASLDALSAHDAAAFARRLEARGFKTLWMPESRGRNVLVNAAWMLASTTTLNIATGIANIYGRDPLSAAAAQKGLNEQSGGRFLLGLGVSHKPIVTGIRGHDYEKPVPTMRRYLEAMKAAPYAAPEPKEPPKTVIAALGPQMLKLAKEAADGAHPYCVTPEHTSEARRILGTGKLLCPEQMVMLETDPVRARAGARVALAPYIAMENYCANWRRLGFNQADLADGGSDRLIDANIVWGDEAAIRQRIQAHWDAGADHVCIQSIHPSGARTELDERIFDVLAPMRKA
ncbi:MAG: TIGR03620 family F420-dependent LLM class oxidoreductase [Proteobacteria bacterium]|nr:TIGR03620 family F420-dependent LLM class oxidoreductase [Pseudomonadota bacterium]